MVSNIKNWTITINQIENVLENAETDIEEDLLIFSSPLIETFSFTPLQFNFENFEPLEHFASIEELP